MKYVILYVTSGGLRYLAKNDLMVDSPDDAIQYASMATGKEALSNMFERCGIFKDQEVNYSVIPAPPQVEEITANYRLPAFPPPDFYETVNKHTAEGILEILTKDTFELGFTPCNKIEGANEMCASAVTDPYYQKIVGRRLQFSFAGTIDTNEQKLLKEAALRNGHYEAFNVYLQGQGPAQWFIIELLSVLK